YTEIFRMEEVWKDVEGWEGYYQVSNLGRVKSLARSVPCSRGGSRNVRGQLRRLSPVVGGYLQVPFRSGENKSSHLVHRLVAKAFVPGYFEGAHVNHIDNDPTNNKAGNLEWCTHQENIGH